LGPCYLYPLLPALVLLLLAGECSAQPAAGNGDRDTLLAVKKDWGSPPQLKAWDPATADHCRWPGVKCGGGAGVVTELSLPNLNLTGSLRFLDLSNNVFTGPLPVDIDGLSPAMEHLNLSTNRFAGEVPPAVARLPALKSLLLDTNHFAGAYPAEEISRLAGLERLTLASNAFAPAPVPPEFAKLTNLSYLWMSDMNLTGAIPEALASLTELTMLAMSANMLSGPLPAWVLQHGKLEMVYLFDNNLSGELPRNVTAPNLVELDLSTNNLTGEIPESVGNLKNLSLFFLYNNQLTGKIPASIALLPRLSDIRLIGIAWLLLRRRKEIHEVTDWKMTAFTQLDFTESDVLSNLREDSVIGTGGSGKKGAPFDDVVDEAIRDPADLQDILSVFTLGVICTGEDPPRRPSMKEVLHHLIRCDRMAAEAQACQMSCEGARRRHAAAGGQEERQPATEHVRLRQTLTARSSLSFTAYTYIIHEPTKDLRKPTVSAMANPHLVCCILMLSLILLSSLLLNSNCAAITREAEKTALLNLESDWSKPVALNWSTSTYKDQCNWRGIICTDGFVTSILLAGCELNKPIPPALCSFKNLMYIDLSRNHITGSFPTTLFNCSRLQYLDLSHNAFNGILPSNIYRLSPNLAYLNLALNRLFGNIPSTISQLYGLKFLYLHRNNFDGSYPPELGHLSELQVLNHIKAVQLELLDLSSNRLNSTIPDGVWRFKSLKMLYLNENSLSGQMRGPVEAFNLVEINVSTNLLTGQIPEDFGNNCISGEIPTVLIRNAPLQVLVLAENMLSGLLPSTIWCMWYLKELDLRKNNLSGQIPGTFGMSMLINEVDTVDLSENNFSGPIPAILAQLEPAFLNLSSNQLTGQIPDPFQINRYEQSFLSNPGLCSSDHFGNLPMCIRLLEDPKEKHEHLNRPLMVILILGSVILICTGPFGFMKIRTFLTRQKQNAPSPQWKLTTFHPVNFNVQDILSCLTNNNLIGCGGSRMVYKICLDNSNCKVIAVKKIIDGLRMDDMLEKQFQAEIETLGSIRHANIVKLLGCISSSESKLLIYEYMEHGSLYDWLHQKDLTSTTEQLNWPMRMSIAIDAARGMCYMHHD
ncbi:hypothetical protein EJB05_41235, partial [Eragrostis curvula]